MTAPVALVTNVRQFAGPGAVEALADEGYAVACHDRVFADPERLAAYGAGDDRLRALPEQDPDELVDAVLAQFGRIDVLVTNDLILSQLYGPPPEAPGPGEVVFRQVALEEATIDEFRATLEALVVRPFALCRAVLPSMKARAGGCIIFITSSMNGRANPKLEMASAARTAATNLAQSLAFDVAPHGIQVNAIGPSWFDNPTYFPERHRDQFMPTVERDVPLRRLGRQDEMGALIAFLASGKAAPLTGQYLAFTAGLSPGH